MIHSSKKNIVLTFLLFLLVLECISQDSATVSKIKYYTKKAEKYLDKEKLLSPYYSINTNGISIYDSPQNKVKDSFEFHIGLDKIDDFNSCIKKCSSQQVFEAYTKREYDMMNPGVTAVDINLIKNDPQLANDSLSHPEGVKKLKGVKVAIDAGHIAGDMEMGNIEKKCLTFKCDSIAGLVDSIAIAEGALTFATAVLLKDKLEAEGANVFMTRPFNNSSAFGVTFDSWLETNYRNSVDSLYKIGKLTLSQKQFFLSAKATKRDKFRVIFKDVDLQKRAEIINNNKPDITIIIHYNVDETNTGWTKPANKNFNMAFVGGAFMKNDLSTPEKRFEFIRLLISNDLEKSIELSSLMVQSFEKNLKVKTATINDAIYLREGCLPTGKPGVYCRNLQLTRYIHSPLVYGETLYQDNKMECKALNKECEKIKNSRVQQVAEAYFQGVLKYMEKQ